jgi:hypothetical protein
MFEALFTFNKDVNYDVIFRVQLLGCALSILFFALEQLGYVGTFDGWWLVFLPFFPTCFRTYVVRGKWRAQLAQDGGKSAKDKKED